MKQLTLLSSFTNYSSYGLHSYQIVKDFVSFGYDVQIEHMFADFKGYDYKDAAGKTEEEKLLVPRMCKPNPLNTKTLILSVPSQKIGEYVNAPLKVLFTMWEANRLPKDTVTNLNTFDQIIVPCEWNACTFNACGVYKPIHICPLGIDPSIYYPRTEVIHDKFIIGCAGRLESGGHRKYLQQFIPVFKKAFPNEKDVELRIKTTPDAEAKYLQSSDPRVVIQKEFIPHKAMADWYRGLDCFVSYSRAEGFGLMPLQAMAIGVPVIAPYFGGLREYFDSSVGMTVDYSLTRCDPGPYVVDPFTAHGVWCDINEEDLISKLRLAYTNRDELTQYIQPGIERAKKYTWEAANRKLESLLIKFGLFN